MTRTVNARIAGIAFLLYFVAGIANMVLYSHAVSGMGAAARLASAALHRLDLRIVMELGLIEAICAFVLAVTLYSLTRVQDADLALLAMLFRFAEGLLVAASTRDVLDQIWLASQPADPQNALAACLLQRPGWNMEALLFACGSTLFAWLLLRGRMIPAPLAWIGVAASLLLVLTLPLQLAGFYDGALMGWVWMPMIAFEIPLGIWLLCKGVRPVEA